MYVIFREAYGALGALWLDAVSENNISLQIAAISNKATLDDIFPNKSGRATSYQPTTSTAIRYMTPDDEDLLAGDLHALDGRMAEATPKPQPTNPGGIPDNIAVDTNGTGK